MSTALLKVSVIAERRMRRIKLVAFAGLAAVFALGAAPASAKVVNLGKLKLDDIVFKGDSFTTVNAKKATAFSDEYDFTIIGNGRLLDGDAHNVFVEGHTIVTKTTNPKTKKVTTTTTIIPAHDILGLHLNLEEDVKVGKKITLKSIAVSGFGKGGLDDDVHIPTTDLFQGVKYHLFVTGTIPKGDKAEYDLNLAVSGVPELSTWAMMLVGFGLVGLQLRRQAGSRRLAATA